MTYLNLEHRLLSRSVMDPATGCWLWMGRVEPNGYAKVGFWRAGGGKGAPVINKWLHRVAFEVFKCAEIPEGHDIDHRCREPTCINPEHLRAITAKANRSAGAKNGNFKRYGR
jgi:hypothetical protein